MRILYFHQHFSTPKGATGTRSYEMAQKLIKLGHEVTLVCGSYNVGATGLSQPFVKGKREGKVDGIQVIEFELLYANNDSFLTRTMQFLRYAMKSIGVAASKDYDLLFATSTPLTASIPGIFAKIFRRKKFVFEVRDLWPELPKAMGVITNPVILSGMSMLEKISYASADGCIGLSPGIVEGIQRRSRTDLPVIMVPNGCDITLFNQQAEDFAWPFDVQPSDLVCCFTGAHGVANGLHNLLNAALELKSRGEKRVKLVFVGEGKTKAELKIHANQQALDNCIFLDAMPKARLAGLLQQADVGLMPLANVPAFYYGTSPNKFFDYISCGLPVVNNYPGWIADMINETGCGIAVEPDNAVKLADALQQLAVDKAQLPAMGEQGLSLAKSRFDRDQLSDQFSQFLQQVAGK